MPQWNLARALGAQKRATYLSLRGGGGFAGMVMCELVLEGRIIANNS